ncbi:MAG: DUF4422 domain-containing protein [Rikenellaceae bacterium]
MKKIKILICTHKDFPLPKGEIYQPIFVGSAISKESIPANTIADDSGDNISARNGSFCELTAQYWGWKNMADVDYLGLCHYRRYFDFDETISGFCGARELEYLNNPEPQKILSHLENNDIIAIRPTKYKTTLRRHYNKNHHASDLNRVAKIIARIYPQYRPSFKRVMSRKEMSICNMFLAPKQLFDNYSKWLFDILFELEKMVDTSTRDNYQKRLFGFLSERLLNVYIEHNKLKVKHLPLVDLVASSDNSNKKRSYIRDLISHTTTSYEGQNITIKRRRIFGVHIYTRKITNRHQKQYLFGIQIRSRRINA